MARGYPELVIPENYAMPASGAKVEISSLYSSVKKYVITDKEGRYRIPKLPNG